MLSNWLANMNVILVSYLCVRYHVFSWNFRQRKHLVLSPSSAAFLGIGVSKGRNLQTSIIINPRISLLHFNHPPCKYATKYIWLYKMWHNSPTQNPFRGFLPDQRQSISPGTRFGSSCTDFQPIQTLWPFRVQQAGGEGWGEEGDWSFYTNKDRKKFICTYRYIPIVLVSIFYINLFGFFT